MSEKKAKDAKSAITDHPGKAEKYEVIDKHGNRRGYASSKDKCESLIEQLEKARPESGPFEAREAE